MRSTCEVICAVKENKETTKEELKMALLVMNSTEYFLKGQLERTLDAIDGGKDMLVKLAAGNAKQFMRTTLFNLHKGDPIKVLGPSGIPGNKEHDDFYAAGCRLVDKLMAKQNADVPKPPTQSRDELSC